MDVRIRQFEELRGRIGAPDWERYKAEILSAPGLVGCWFLDEGRGDRVIDASGKGNHGTVYGARWVKERGVWTLSFDGVDDYVEVPSSASLSFNGKLEITVEVWVRIPFTVDFAHIVGTYDWSAGGGYMLAIHDDITKFYVNTELGYTVVFSSRKVNDNVWHYWVGRYDSAELSVWIDGEKTGAKSWEGSITEPTRDLLIGVDQGFTRWLLGLTTEVRIYNRALSADEVARHHQLGRQFYPA